MADSLHPLNIFPSISLIKDMAASLFKTVTNKPLHKIN